MLAAWVGVGFSAAWLRADRQHLRCTFVHVGHGEAIVLELPSGKTCLRAGEFGAPRAATQSVAGFLWSRGITHLDAIVLSHADADHYNAIPGLLERFSAGVVYVSPVMWEEKKSGVQFLQDAIHRPESRSRRFGPAIAWSSGPVAPLRCCTHPNMGSRGQTMPTA